MDEGERPDSEQPISSLASSQWDGLEGELCPISVPEVQARSLSWEFEPERVGESMGQYVEGSEDKNHTEGGGYKSMSRKDENQKGTGGRQSQPGGSTILKAMIRRLSVPRAEAVLSQSPVCSGLYKPWLSGLPWRPCQ